MKLSTLWLTVILLWILQPAQAAVVLIYHHIAEDTPRVSSTTEDEFRQHLTYLQENDFEVIGLDTLLQQLQQGKAVADNAVVITFDDGYENNFTTAHPILMEFGFPYTIFISPGDIDNRTGPVMSWPQIKQMSDDGVLVANHAMYHEKMAQPNPNESEQEWLARMKDTIVTAEQRIKEETGQSHQWLAYPYGEFSPALESLVKELGFIGIGQQSGAVGPTTKLTRLPRFPAAGRFADMTDLSQKLRTLPFSIIQHVDANPMVHSENNPPVLTLKVEVEDFRPAQLRCYAGMEVIEPDWLDDQTFQAQASKAVNQGRSRYNCTAPSISKRGYFYWYSQPWLYGRSSD
ncbi:polysaccharide deacetylase family protein [Alkalimonas collagenimarina]|uniref:Polysaccharide deacetylase family protein n=1 Tax=Alkalimonas collagenimarina TaxID=400390 RepID=A0ABT9GX54_9GAMM|nr:polysaccharide deacetylase family protein [Alkalimonas collagenimarina]MDP4535637.1 polysaccharide deacetylase family protein [Alkalimonas collagenimarina]